jgi:hypothetical protein
VTSKTVKSQVKKAVQLIREGSDPETIIEAAFTSVNEELSLEEFENMVEVELEKNNHA